MDHEKMAGSPMSWIGRLFAAPALLVASWPAVAADPDPAPLPPHTTSVSRR
jgi:hypothetical protein